MLDERIDYGLGVFTGHSDQHHVTCLALNQGRDSEIPNFERQLSPAAVVQTT
jgi:hypothetical protein